VSTISDEVKKKKTFWIWLIYIFAGGLLLLILLYLYIIFTLPDVKVLKDSNPKTTALIEDRKSEAEAADKRFTLRQKWIQFKQMPELLKKSVRISEDAGFYLHGGYDLEELQESIKKNWKEGRFARGGSTITQQLAKNLYLSTEKSIWRKLREYFIARELEDHLSKNRIFHLYLNLIEFGPGIFGVEAASRYYFGKAASQLSEEEMIRLTAIIPRPLKTRPDTNSKWLLWRCRWIVDKLYLYKYIDKTAHDYLKACFN
jgi:monofunctional biosynthetic peptidoglycan transglycosylase